MEIFSTFYCNRNERMTDAMNFLKKKIVLEYELFKWPIRYT